MADELDSKEESTEDTESEEVETEESEDESTDEQATEESPAEETSDDSEESDDSQTDAFDKRFTQFKGDTLDEYTKNLEEAYANSTAEYAKLNKSQAEQRQQETTDAPATDPALLYARQQMEQQQSQEFDAFAKDHPEIESDPEIAEKMTKRLATLARTVLAEDGKVLGMAEGLSMAWSSLNLGNNQQENTRMAAKDAAATSKTASAKKTVPKTQFTTQQLEFAKKAGLTEKDLVQTK